MITGQQRPLFLGLKGGFCSQVWMSIKFLFLAKNIDTIVVSNSTIIFGYTVKLGYNELGYNEQILK